MNLPLYLFVNFSLLVISSSVHVLLFLLSTKPWDLSNFRPIITYKISLKTTHY